MNVVVKIFFIEGDYKICDIMLVDWGCKELDIVEYEMLGLMLICCKYQVELLLKGVCVIGLLYMIIQIVVLIEILKDIGVDVCWVLCNIFLIQDYVVVVIVVIGILVFVWKGEILEEYWDCILDVLIFILVDGILIGLELVVDDGGDVILLIYKGYELENGSDWVNIFFVLYEE